VILQKWPAYLGESPPTIRPPHLGDTVGLSPPAAALPLAEAKPNARRSSECDWLEVANLLGDRAPHLFESLEQGCAGLTTALMSGGRSTPPHRWILPAG
jgi:hypothetical protein